MSLALLGHTISLAVVSASASRIPVVVGNCLNVAILPKGIVIWRLFVTWPDRREDQANTIRGAY